MEEMRNGILWIEADTPHGRVYLSHPFANLGQLRHLGEVILAQTRGYEPDHHDEEEGECWRGGIVK
jgi:hypothetical protein